MDVCLSILADWWLHLHQKFLSVE